MPYTSYAGDSLIDPPESIIHGSKGNNNPRVSKNIP